MSKLQANTNLAKAPADLDIKRSRLDRSFGHKTSFNVGDLIPIYCEEVLPGDTFDLQTNAVVRLQSLLTPIMDNLYLDTSFWFVPMRLTWDHTKQFFGENTDSAWIPQVEYTIPQITAPVGGWQIGTLADHFGIPTGVSGISVSALPFRAYALICNEWWRSENLTDPLNIPTNDTTQLGSNGSNYLTDVVNGGMPFKAAKFFDLFTAALPAPQKGPDVMLNMADGFAPVVTRGEFVPQDAFMQGGNTAYGFYFKNPSFGAPTSRQPSTQDVYYNNIIRGSTPYDSDDKAIYGSHSSVQPTKPSRSTDSSYMLPANLFADNTVLPGISIAQFRLAFQIQRFYERQARSGSRYTEVIKSFFGVTSPDYRLQRPEYLGGRRQSININAVTQTSATQSGSTPQGNQAAYSVTHTSHNDFFKSFTEHGFVIGLAVVRYDHSYQQGISKMWSRKTKFDFYWPVFANLSEMPILNKELYAQGNAQDDEVFGYQEAWYDYRYPKNLISGSMRSQAPLSLDVWHLGDDYNALPRLSDQWLREDKNTVDRVLAVTSSVSDQLFADFWFKNYVTRPMPVFSIPGLVDHH